MKFAHTILIGLVLSLSIGGSVRAQEANYRPPGGLVPDANTAIAIAIAVWTPIYGKKLIASEKPYQATLANGQWTVTGSLPKGWNGGVALAVIAKADGRVLRVIHGK